MKSISLILLLLLNTSLFGQNFVEITPLSSSLGESSGLIFQNGKIITHNDSGGEPALYEIDSVTGNAARTVVVSNASNVDWEDITADDNYIYIGDFGNNAGNRTNLKIYRVSLTEYWNTPNDTVTADTIRFSFADQTDFTSAPQATNYDCEALATINDSLYLFTKNWINAKTYVYRLPNLPGTYVAPRIDSIAVQGLITGADYHTSSNRLTLCGYTQYPFVVEMNNPLGGKFHQNVFARYNLTSGPPLQLEAIVAFTDNNYFLTAESFQGVAVRLYRLHGKEGISSLSENDLDFFSISPNPSTGKFTLQFDQFQEDIHISVYGTDGKSIYSSLKLNGLEHSFTLDYPKGFYLLQVRSNNEIYTKTIQII